jgi:hypothetical protein
LHGSIDGQKEVFRASLYVPWNDWPTTTVDVSLTTKLLSYEHKLDYSINLNEIMAGLLSKKYNVIVVIDTGDPQPFFLRHFPALSFSSQSSLVTLSSLYMQRLLAHLGCSKNSRIVALRVDPLLTASIPLEPYQLENLHSLP